MSFPIRFSKDSPAYLFYQELRKQGFSDQKLDVGFYQIDYRIPGPNLHLVNKKRVHEEREILELVVEDYERYRSLIEGYTGYPLGWVLDDAALRAKAEEAIKELEKEVPGKDPEDLEKKAVALYYFAAFADDPKIILENQKKLTKMTEELASIGLKGFQNYLFRKGGLGMTNLDDFAAFFDVFFTKEKEYSATEAIKLKQGWCTEKSKILYALYRMAGLDPQFVMVPSRELTRFAKAMGGETPPNQQGFDHVLIGLKTKDRMRLFDLTLSFSDAAYVEYYPLRLIHFLSLERMNRGNYFLDGEKIDEAIKEFQEAIRLNPDAAGPYVGLCSALPLIEKPKEAIQACSAAIERDTKTAPAYGLLGNLHLDQGEIQEAMDAYRKGMKVDPEDQRFYGKLADLLTIQKRFDEAIVICNKAIVKFPRNVRFPAGLAILYLKMGDLKKAAEIFKGVEYLAVDPRYLLPYGIALWRLGKKEDSNMAFRNFQFILEKDLKVDPKIRKQTGLGMSPGSVFSWIQEWFKEIPAELKGGKREIRPVAQILYQLSDYYRTQGNQAAEKECLSMAKELNPER